MGRNPSSSNEGLNKGAWTAAEDKKLTDYIKIHGEGKWRNVPKKAGLQRCGKSCRLRWLNYLRPDIKRGNISHDEEELIIRLHKLLGNRWSLIAGRLPGRTDNEIKNYWNTNIGKKLLRDQQIQSQSQIPSSSARRPSYQYPARPNLAAENSKFQSAEAEKGSYAIKPKASKGTKVVIAPPEPQKFDQDQVIESKQLVAGLSMVNASVDNNDHNAKGMESLPEFNLQENNLPNLPDDFMMDLQMDDHLLSFLNSADFSQLSYFDNNGGQVHDSDTTHTYRDQGCLSADSDENLLFSEEKKKVHDTDFPSMDSLIGPEFGWFQE